jgi:hypothetical protein
VTGDAGGRGRSRWRAEDGARPPDMRVHARFADPEEPGDLFRGETSGDRAEDLTLTIGQRRAGAVAPREDTAGYEVADKETDKGGTRAPHPKVSDRGLRLPQLARFKVRRSLARMTSCSKRSRNSCPPQRGQSG